MKKWTMGWMLVAMAVCMAPWCALAQQQDASYEASYNAVLSKLQSMSHGYYSAQEWAVAEAEVDALVKNASDRNDGHAYVRAVVVKAMTQGDMRREYDHAIKILQDARKQVKKMKGVDASPLFVKEAEMYGEMGNSAAVARLIEEYKNSSYYDPKPYTWSGGAKPGDPLVIARPNATEGDSIPLSIMEKALRRANSAPGLAFPNAVMTDIHGKTFAIADFRGKVVLVDFFARGWRIWEDRLPQQVDTWKRYHADGFEIISVCLERNPQGLDQLLLPWSVVAGAPDLTRTLSIFGDSTNFLLNQDGMVIARDLRGQDLLSAVRQALGL